MFKHRFCHTVSSPPWHIYKPWQTYQKFFGLYHWILLAEGWKVVMGLSLLPFLPLQLSAKSRNTTNLSVKMHWPENRVYGSVENQGEADTSLVISGHRCPDTLRTTHTLYPQQKPSVGMALCLLSAQQILVPPARVPTTIDLLREPVQPCEQTLIT